MDCIFGKFHVSLSININYFKGKVKIFSILFFKQQQYLSPPFINGRNLYRQPTSRKRMKAELFVYAAFMLYVLHDVLQVSILSFGPFSCGMDAALSVAIIALPMTSTTCGTTAFPSCLSLSTLPGIPSSTPQSSVATSGHSAPQFGKPDSV